MSSDKSIDNFELLYNPELLNNPELLSSPRMQCIAFKQQPIVVCIIAKAIHSEPRDLIPFLIDSYGTKLINYLLEHEAYTLSVVANEYGGTTETYRKLTKKLHSWGIVVNFKVPKRFRIKGSSPTVWAFKDSSINSIEQCVIKHQKLNHKVVQKRLPTKEASEIASVLVDELLEREGFNPHKLINEMKIKLFIRETQGDMNQDIFYAIVTLLKSKGWLVEWVR